MIKLWIILGIAAVIGLLIWWYNYTKEISKRKAELSKKYELAERILDKQLKEKLTDYNNKFKSLNQEYNEKARQLKEQLDLLNIHQLELVKKETELVDAKVREYYESQKVIEQKKFDEWKEDIDTQVEMYCDILDAIKTEISDFQQKRAAINEAIRREEETKNEIDFHRIILSQESKDDIQYLLSLEDKLNNKTLLHKLIWSEYLQKPFNQMLKNCFGNNIPKGVIYCIENIESHKKYIGRTSAEVSKRWTEHMKTTLGIGTVKRSNIHSALYKHWDEFTFSVLEVVDSSKLSEREKFYIQLFETDKYGYNMNSGG